MLLQNNNYIRCVFYVILVHLHNAHILSCLFPQSAASSGTLPACTLISNSQTQSQNNLECECPCYTSTNYNYCDNDFNINRSVGVHATCPHTVTTLSYVSNQWGTLPMSSIPIM